MMLGREHELVEIKGDPRAVPLLDKSAQQPEIDLLLDIKEPTSSPLLDLAKTEIYQIRAVNVITGFSLMSGPASILEANVAKGSTFAMTSLMALGIAGGIAGAYRARREIAKEREKVIRLNKELFLMLNVAADQWDDWQRKLNPRVSADDKDDNVIDEKEQSATSQHSEREYFRLVTEIQLAIASPINALKNVRVEEENEQQTDQAKRKYTTDIERMSNVVQAYVKHRDSSAGKKEKKLWKLLKKKKIKRKDRTLQNYFLDYSSASQAKDYFHGHSERQKDAYQSNMAKLKKLLSSMEENQMIVMDTEYYNSKNLFLVCLQDIHHLTEAFNKRYAESQGNMQNVRLLKNFLDPTSEAYAAVVKKIKAVYKNHAAAIDNLWNNELRPLIETVDDNFKNLFNDETKDIPDMTPTLFGDHGSFRQFWRQIELHDQKATPINLDQQIYRGGKANHTSMGLVGFGVVTGLFTTGKGLYAAAIALGAVPLGTIEVVCIVGAIAIALMLLCLYCNYHTQKAQNNRDILLRQLEDGLTRVLTKKTPDKAQELAATPLLSASIFMMPSPPRASSSSEASRTRTPTAAAGPAQP